MLLILTSLQDLKWDPNKNPNSGQLEEISIIQASMESTHGQSLLFEKEFLAIDFKRVKC